MRGRNPRVAFFIALAKVVLNGIKSMTDAEIAALNAETEAFLAAPQSATVDGRSATNRSADDFIKLKNFEAAQSAAGTGKGQFGLRFTRLIPPGTG